ncbi:2Fe-2S iron-sulfur cluster-binding protein [Pseudomonas sp. CGJS7]|uniref:2Fe-2S iron-sulfur cluster-binding protein n=1 Tax=Pseudomonas sp. CGJS7 TaxID=3109348 RepID=UPI0030099E7B
MPRAFARIGFTPSVQQAQQRYGSREANRSFELSDDARDEIGEREAEFIGERDSFYQATVGEEGWPYVQHRGGPAGFLRVLDSKTLGYADFRGNRQYLSVGNLGANERISLILMDYPNRRRLKIWGRARIVHEDENPELIARLEMPAYRARVERGVVIEVEACDWNCPQHITPRYTEAEVEQLIEPLREQLRQAQAVAAEPERKPDVLGEGALELTIAAVRQATPRVRIYELRAPNGGDLPAFAAGAHLRVPVPTADGYQLRHYSISSDPARRDVYEIAVLREDTGRGGSKALHAAFELGLKLRCDPPRNYFQLDPGTRPALLIAGGIGITPIKAMAHALAARGVDFELHYAGRGLREMPFADTLPERFPALSLYPSDQGLRLDLRSTLAAAPADALIYVCGPERMVEATLAAAHELGIVDRVRSERFSASAGADARPIEVHLRRSNRTLAVTPQQTVLEAVRIAGIDAPSNCAAGHCGTCAVKVLQGVAEHRDTALTEAERERSRLMCICVSRAQSDRLVLDL